MGAVSCVLSLSLVVLGVVGGFPVVAGAPEAGSAAGAAREGGGPPEEVPKESSGSSSGPSPSGAGPFDGLSPLPLPVQAILSTDVAADPRTVGVPAFVASGTEQQEMARRLAREATQALREHPRLTVVPPEGVAEAVSAAPLFPERIDLARRHVEEGIRLYKVMRLGEAIEQFGKAIALLELTAAAWAEPDLLRRAYLYTALAALEEGDRPAAHLNFKRLLTLEPSFRLRPGYASPTAQAAFDVALNDVLAAGLPDPDPTSMVRLAGLCRADYLLLGRVQPRAEEGWALALSLFDVANRRYLDSDLIPLKGDASAGREDAERLDRAVSRLVACIPDRGALARQQPPPPFRSALVLDVGVDTTLFLQRFTRDVFRNHGLSVGAMYRMDENLAAMLRGSLTASVTDSPREDLRDTMNLLRVVAGAGLFLGGDDLHAFLAPGVEVAFPGRVLYTYDADCKWEPSRFPECRPGQRIVEHDPGFLAGANLLLRGGWRFLDSLEAQFSLGLTYYFLAGKGNQLNLPVHATIGTGYRF